ncbi:hypothetical protein HOY82DRAFT_573946 [Tuber indicum]|nr:hypothetical protein HOY82DRAFT_573946 [Tuber indicum]
MVTRRLALSPVRISQSAQFFTLILSSISFLLGGAGGPVATMRFASHKSHLITNDPVILYGIAFPRGETIQIWTTRAF